MSFRAATAQDLRTFAAFDRRCFRLEEPWTTRDYREHFSDPASRYVVAEEHGCVAGFAGAETVNEEMTVMVLLVDPKFRRRGLGRALMEEMLRWAQRSRVSRVTLHVRCENAQAVGLYRSLGFEVTSELDDFYRPGVDAFEMTLSLAGQSTAAPDGPCAASRTAGPSGTGSFGEAVRPTQ